MRAKQRNPLIRVKYAGLTDDSGRWNGQIRTIDKNLELPFQVKKPTTWAVWNDLFHEDVPTMFILEALAVMACTPQHTYLILTKRHERMHEVLTSPTIANDVLVMTTTGLDASKPLWPLPNVWLGVTAENQEQADKRIPALLQIPAAVRFVSVEPMIGPANLTFLDDDGIRVNALTGQRTDMGRPCWDTGRLDWIICGGESGPGARPLHPDWARNLRDQCQAACVPFFFKQRGEYSWDGFNPYYGHGSDSGKWDEYICFNGEHGQCKINDDDGTWINYTGKPDDTACIVRRVDKKAAGCLLDGREHKEIPRR